VRNNLVRTITFGAVSLIDNDGIVDILHDEVPKINMSCISIVWFCP